MLGHQLGAASARKLRWSLNACGTAGGCQILSSLQLSKLFLKGKSECAPPRLLCACVYVCARAHVCVHDTWAGIYILCALKIYKKLKFHHDGIQKTSIGVAIFPSAPIPRLYRALSAQRNQTASPGILASSCLHRASGPPSSMAMSYRAGSREPAVKGCLSVLIC